MNEPTAEQCSAGAQVAVNGRQGVAMWWPQMGGYAGKAVAFADDGCLDVLVWHDGNFPFNGTCPSCGDGRVPAEVHVCDPGQWARLASDLASVAQGLLPWSWRCTVENLSDLVRGMNASMTSGIPGEGWGNEEGAVVGISHDPDMDGDASGGSAYAMAGRIGHRHTFGDKGTPNPVPKPSAFYRRAGEVAAAPRLQLGIRRGTCIRVLNCGHEQATEQASPRPLLGVLAQRTPRLPRGELQVLVPPDCVARGIDRDGNSCEIAMPRTFPGDAGRWLVAEGWRWAMVLAGDEVAGYVMLDVSTLARAWKEEESRA